MPRGRSSSPDKVRWIRTGTNLSEEDKKHCRCLLDVAAKQSESCLRGKEWPKHGSYKDATKGCYGPYAICPDRSGKKLRCGEYYNYEEIPDKYLLAYINLHNLPLANGAKATREEMLNAIYASKQLEYGSRGRTKSRSPARVRSRSPSPVRMRSRSPSPSI
jgi:hypothetical protein